MSEHNSQRYLLLINAELDEAFKEWYRNVHLPEVIAAVEGYGSAAHFDLASFQPSANPTDLRRHLTIVQIEGDPQKVFAAVAALWAAGKLTASPETGRFYQTLALFKPAGGAEFSLG